jgi:hypothetical protein
MKQKDSLKHRIGLTMILLALVAALSAATVSAQDMGAVRRTIVGRPETTAFLIDLNGDMTPDMELRIDRLADTTRDSASITGRFNRAGMSAPSPRAPNVTGTITIVRAGADSVRGNAISITFTATERVGSPLFGQTATLTFTSALRLNPPQGSGQPLSFAFLTGVLTTTGGVTGGASTAPGPYPFCANLVDTPG